MRKLFLAVALIGATSTNIVTIAQPLSQPAQLNPDIKQQVASVPMSVTATPYLEETLAPNRAILAVTRVGQEKVPALTREQLFDSDWGMKLTPLIVQQRLKPHREKWRVGSGGLRWLGQSG